MGIQPELVGYFDLLTRYDATKTLVALEDTDVTCPPFEADVEPFVRYVRDHPPAGDGPMA